MPLQAEPEQIREPMLGLDIVEQVQGLCWAQAGQQGSI